MVYLPLWKIWVRQLGWWNSQYMESHKICSKPPIRITSVFKMFWAKTWGFTIIYMERHRFETPTLCGTMNQTPNSDPMDGGELLKIRVYTSDPEGQSYVDGLTSAKPSFYRGFSIAAVFVTICLSWFSGDNPISTQKLPWPNQPGITQRSQPSVLV